MRIHEELEDIGRMIGFASGYGRAIVMNQTHRGETVSTVSILRELADGVEQSALEPDEAQPWDMNDRAFIVSAIDAALGEMNFQEAAEAERKSRIAQSQGWLGVQHA